MKNDNQYHNIGKIVSYSNILFLIFFNLIGCDKIVDPQDGQDNTKNLVAFTAVLYDNSDDLYIEKLVIADFYDLDNYEISTNTVIFHWGPVFSGDKSKMLFGVPGLADGGPKIELYDLQTNQTLKS